ncbi:MULTISPECIES: type IV secretory system conjugative DNA transfer family protein [Streptomyces]|uniref:Type VI secretion protein n=1 Tax=Streptomyces koelreuteriae TaxID=2838015 RepID=A0ABX8FUI8_9ACTN|nr:MULTISPECIES: type IV secretory system conjugative DNA transfer family protein [Streptomyces]QWB24675.1 type VI secretion protein [Streptomyces koelreuteriae]UUA07686.1 type VI secretion protein [Streptomyces koelreuteriae]UUA15315.1 type VI secretion protein [Streptomyces sp. CRCS-T-1]
MRPDDRRTQRDSQGGIPDGLLIGILAFLLGMTLLVWTATGLAALFAHGSWPSGVTFTRTPLAMRALVAQPHDIPAAWPDTPPGELSGYGLFWGLFIGQLMILVVLTVFVMGTLARWRAVRARRREESATAAGRGPADAAYEAHTPPRHETRGAAHEPTSPTVRHEAPGAVRKDFPTAAQGQASAAVQHEFPTGAPGQTSAWVQHEFPAAAQHETPAAAHERTSPAVQHEFPAAAQGHAPPTAQHEFPTPAQDHGPASTPHEVPTPRRSPSDPTGPTSPLAPTADPPTTPATPASLFAQERVGRWEKILVAPRESRQTTATQAIRDAAGPALVVTSNPTLWQNTKDARAKLGPTHLYDPTHLCDTPSRLHWSPTTGCEDKATATRRATALLTPVRPTSKLDQALSDTAEILLRSYLHAAAIDGRTIRHVHRWSQGTQIQDAVRILRTNPKAAPGAAGELEGTLTAHPERRDMAQQLTTRALAALSTVNIREACTPNRSDALALDSFVHEGGTLYVVGESIEDPRTQPGAMPLLTALVSSVVERGRHMAERSSSGRLDPPMTLVLDDVAAVAPLPQLPELLATGADRGMPTLALLRSREQARARWPHDELPV